MHVQLCNTSSSSSIRYNSYSPIPTPQLAAPQYTAPVANPHFGNTEAALAPATWQRANRTAILHNPTHEPQKARTCACTNSNKKRKMHKRSSQIQNLIALGCILATQTQNCKIGFCYDSDTAKSKVISVGVCERMQARVLLFDMCHGCCGSDTAASTSVLIVIPATWIAVLDSVRFGLGILFGGFHAAGMRLLGLVKWYLVRKVVCASSDSTCTSKVSLCKC